MLWVQLSPEALAALSDEATQLEASFNVVPFRRIAVRADSEISMLIKSLARRMVTLPQEHDSFASALFEESLLKMFVILVLRACIHAEQHRHYIEQGRPITEVYRLGGFGGYNHFFRAFKQEYGMTPKQYFRSVQKDAHA